MSFESVDGKSDCGWQKSFSERSPDAKLAEAKEQKKIVALLSFLHDLPPGAYSLLERLTLISFDLNTFSIHPKRLPVFTPETTEIYLVFDTVFNSIFFLQGLFDENQMRALQLGCESYFGADLVWVPIEPESWNELHQYMVTQSTHLKNDEGKNTDVKNEVNEDEIRKKIQSLMSLGDLAQFFNKSLNKVKELEEALRESIEAESEEMAEERRERLKFKELLKQAIKEEIAKERLLVEEIKQRQLESLPL